MNDTAHFEQIAIIGADTMTYLDSVVVSDSAYFYKIAIIAGGKESRKSNPTESVVPVIGVPKLDITRGTVTLTPKDTLPFYSLNDEKMVLSLVNHGTANLTLSSLIPSTKWLSVTGFSPKTLQPDSAIQIEISVLWDSLDTNQSAYKGSVTVASSAGAAIVIPITALKKDKYGFLTVTNELPLDFTSTQSQIELILTNGGNIDVESCKLSTSSKWITLSDPSFSAIGAGKSEIVTLTIDRENLTDGDNRIQTGKTGVGNSSG